MLQKKTWKNIIQVGLKFWSVIQNAGSGPGKANSIFNLISKLLHIEKINLYAKDPYEAKYQFLKKKQESTGLKHLNDSKAFIEYSNDMDDKNIEEF